MILKLLITILIAWLALGWLRKQQNKNQSMTRRSHKEEVGEMVRCKVCNLHIPRAEALEKEGDFYCSQAHLEQDR